MNFVELTNVFKQMYTLYMSKRLILNALKKYQKASAKKRKKYFDAFQERMLFRTTKTENPETTRAMVRKVLGKR